MCPAEVQASFLIHSQISKPSNGSSNEEMNIPIPHNSYLTDKYGTYFDDLGSLRDSCYPGISPIDQKLVIALSVSARLFDQQAE